MDRLERIESAAVPLGLDDVDTDVITPLRRIMEGMDSMIEHAFEALRFAADESPRDDCVLNDPRWSNAEILVAGRNFGCGSSRETAVWAVRGMGYRCVIAAGFGDIFRANCLRNGVLPVQLAAADVAALLDEAQDPAARFVVDLPTCSVTSPRGRIYGFDVSPLRREALLEGLDDLSLTLRRTDAIDAFERRDSGNRPWAGPPGS